MTNRSTIEVRRPQFIYETHYNYNWLCFTILDLKRRYRTQSIVADCLHIARVMERLLSDLRRINHLLQNDYHKTNFPISNMPEAINHFAGTRSFTKLDCSHAYHCVQWQTKRQCNYLHSISQRAYMPIND